MVAINNDAVQTEGHSHVAYGASARTSMICPECNGRPVQHGVKNCPACLGTGTVWGNKRMKPKWKSTKLMMSIAAAVMAIVGALLGKVSWDTATAAVTGAVMAYCLAEGYADGQGARK